MQPLLYDELVPWYRLLDPPADHGAEADAFRSAFERVVPGASTLLELGAGAGHNALHMKRTLRCTLSDLSPRMLDLSRELNPECEHVLADMRDVRLGRSFDVVLVHDAICYMTTRADLRAAAESVFAHTRPGGAAILAPDFVRDTFRDQTDWLEEEEADGQRALRCMAWSSDPDPGDDTYVVDYGFLLRDQNGVRGVHDRHVEGLFSRALWQETLASVGFSVEPLARPPRREHK